MPGYDFMAGDAINQSGAMVQNVGGILGGIFGSAAERNHAQRIREAGDKAISYIGQGITQGNAAQKQYLGNAVGYLSPFQQMGTRAGNSLADLLMGGGDVSSMLKASPLFNFESQIGSTNINRELAARGLYGSGSGLATLARFNNQLVGEEANNLYSRLFGVAQLGEQAGNSMAGITSQTGNAIADRIFNGKNMQGEMYYDSRLGASTAQLNGALMQVQGMQNAFVNQGGAMRQAGQSLMAGGGGGGMGGGMGMGSMFGMIGG